MPLYCTRYPYKGVALSYDYKVVLCLKGVSIVSYEQWIPLQEGGLSSLYNNMLTRCRHIIVAVDTEGGGVIGVSI